MHISSYPWQPYKTLISTHNRVANPCTSLARSALPLEPATVEKRTNVEVRFPCELRNDAEVMLLQSPLDVKVP